jgi:hypothetical protein
VAETYRDVHNDATVKLTVSVKGGAVRLGTHADADLRDPLFFFFSFFFRTNSHTVAAVVVVVVVL